MAASLDVPTPELTTALSNQAIGGASCGAIRATVSQATSSFDALRVGMVACTRCPKLALSRSRVVPGHGSIPANIAFIGIAPGRFGGDRTGIPFAGDRSGDLLRRMIKHARLSGVFITNLVRCNPRDARNRNRDPDASEIANCGDYLAAELELARPRIIVCLGRIAWQTLAGREIPFTPSKPLAIKRSGTRLFPMYHPGYVVRGAYLERSYRRDFRRLRASYAQLPAASP